MPPVIHHDNSIVVVSSSMNNRFDFTFSVHHSVLTISTLSLSALDKNTSLKLCIAVPDNGLQGGIFSNPGDHDVMGTPSCPLYL